MTDLALHLGAFLREHLPRDRRACRLKFEQLSVQLILDFLDFLERER